MIELLAMFAGGLLGSAHCIGMCGGFAAMIGASHRPMPQAIARQLTYGLGRVFTYMFMGGMGGYAGLQLGRLGTILVDVQRTFSIGAGLLMIVIGAATLTGFGLRWRWLTKIGSAAAPVFRQFLNGPGRGGVFLVGIANGFLPCGLVLAFLALAVASGSPLHGMLIMLFFGLGTLPAMTAFGCGSTLLSHAARGHVYRIAACFVILAGSMSIRRAWTSGSVESCCGVHAGHAVNPAPPITLAAEP